MSAELTFLAVATGPYKRFAPLYAATALWHVPNSAVELVVDDIDAFYEVHGGAIRYLRKQLSERIHVRQYHSIFTGWEKAHLHGLQPNTIRWLEAPSLTSKYTYIGDVDILVCETDIVRPHVHHMAVLGLPYSNIRRLGRPNLTGLHFVNTDAWYCKVDVAYRLRLAERLASGQIRKWDEQLLFAIAKERFGVPPESVMTRDPNDVGFRCQHGIHVSPNRVRPKGWKMVSYAFAYQRFRRSRMMRGLVRRLDDESRDVVAELDSARLRSPVSPEPTCADIMKASSTAAETPASST